MATVVSFDAGELESKVKAMYRDVQGNRVKNDVTNGGCAESVGVL